MLPVNGILSYPCCAFPRNNLFTTTITTFVAARIAASTILTASSTNSMAQWVRAWDFLTCVHAVLEVGGSNPVRCTIVGPAFHATWQLAIFSPLNMPFIVNSKFI